MRLFRFSVWQCETNMSLAFDSLLERALRGEVLNEHIVRLICLKLKNMLIAENNIVAVSAPVIVVGDLHGQFFDLLELFKIGGYPPDVSYLFLGDYVDRGACSIETITLLALYKIIYPDRITLLRGNHETRSITQVYGFFAECHRKYENPAVWTDFTDVFDFLPIAATINGEYFCVHGGLSPSVSLLDDIKKLERKQEIPHEGSLTDLMWSDPDETNPGFGVSSRGAGYLFGGDIVSRFLFLNRISHIIRAHQLCNDGFQVLFQDSFSTVWSAPNYCYRFGNKASILMVDEYMRREFVVFSDAPENAKLVKERGFEPQTDNLFI